jgi:hypothetical protein
MIFEQIKLSEQMDDVHKVYISLKKHYFISISLISYAKKQHFLVYICHAEVTEFDFL